MIQEVKQERERKGTSGNYTPNYEVLRGCISQAIIAFKSIHVRMISPNLNR